MTDPERADELPTTCLKCGSTEMLTTPETLEWMKIHPAKCKRGA